MNAEYARVLAEEIVDWVCSTNPDKDSLQSFSIGLTSEGMSIRGVVLEVLRPLLIYRSVGRDITASTKFPRETLLYIAKQAIERMALP